MKPNDKAIEAAVAEGKRWKVDNKIPRWKVLRQDENQYGYDVIAEFNYREDRDEALERLRAEAMVDAAYAAQFPPSEDYRILVNSLRDSETRYIAGVPAADALEAVLAERAAWKGRQEATAALLKQVETERDEWEAAYKQITDTHAKIEETTVDKLKKVETERDALAARLAPVDDEALVEIAVNEMRKQLPASGVMYIHIANAARAAIAAIRPHIEAAERERCANIAEHLSGWGSDFGKGGHAMHIASVIRSGK